MRRASKRCSTADSPAAGGEGRRASRVDWSPPLREGCRVQPVIRELTADDVEQVKWALYAALAWSPRPRTASCRANARAPTDSRLGCREISRDAHGIRMILPFDAE